MNFETIETWFKRNKWTSILLTILFVIGLVFSVTDYTNRLVTIGKELIGYKEPIIFEINADGTMKERMTLARLEATKYKIPSSSTSVIKFISLPMLNQFHKNAIEIDPESTHAIVTSISPIKPISGEQVFDGGDCRFSVRASSFDQDHMVASFEVISLSCTDNQGYAYTIEAKTSIGYLSEIGNPGINSVKIIDDEGYLTIDPDNNYFVQLYEPIKSINNRGISLFGRF